MNKKCLKDKGKPITESPTVFRRLKLKNERDEFFNVWTVDDKIMLKNNNNGKPNVFMVKLTKCLKTIEKKIVLLIEFVVHIVIYWGRPSFYFHMCMGL